MIQDLHSHTYYSACGSDSPECLIETAIEGGIEVLGICDHNYGIAGERTDTVCPRKEKRLVAYQRAITRYLDHMRLVAKQYEGRIKIWHGIEIATLPKPHWPLPDEIDISMFDYCLIESISSPDTVIPDLFTYAKRCNCKYVGVAHTDIPVWLERTGQDMFAFFSRMAEEGIFWEINVNYDSTHNYREHAYIRHVFEDEELQKILRDSGVKLSVGFDSHQASEYAPERIKDACHKITDLGLPLVHFE